MPGADSPPVGTIALLFTDIAGSTAAARAAGEQWGELLATHHELVGGAIAARLRRA
jgi:class 3 adenylate cyclase